MQLSRREFQQSTRELSQMLRKSRSGLFWRRTSLSLVESLVSSARGTGDYLVNPQPLLAVAGARHSAREGGMGYSGLPDPAWWYWAQQSVLLGMCCRLQGGCAVSVHGGREVLLITKSNLEVNVCSHALKPPPGLLQSNIDLCLKMMPAVALPPLQPHVVVFPQAQQWNWRDQWWHRSIKTKSISFIWIRRPQQRTLLGGNMAALWRGRNFPCCVSVLSA